MKNEDGIKDEDDVKNEDITKNQDNTKMSTASTTLPEKTRLGLQCQTPLRSYPLTFDT